MRDSEQSAKVARHQKRGGNAKCQIDSEADGGRVPARRVYVFVHPGEEAVYLQALNAQMKSSGRAETFRRCDAYAPERLTGKVVTGKVGLKAQRNYQMQFFPEETYSDFSKGSMFPL